MEKIGFIGLGIMGKPITLSWAEAGYSLVVSDQNKTSGEFVNAGAAALFFPAIRTEHCDAITRLPDSPKVEATSEAVV